MCATLRFASGGSLNPSRALKSRNAHLDVDYPLRIHTRDVAKYDNIIHTEQIMCFLNKYKYRFEYKKHYSVFLLLLLFFRALD